MGCWEHVCIAAVPYCVVTALIPSVCHSTVVSSIAFRTGCKCHRSTGLSVTTIPMKSLALCHHLVREKLLQIFHVIGVSRRCQRSSILTSQQCLSKSLPHGRNHHCHHRSVHTVHVSQRLLCAHSCSVHGLAWSSETVCLSDSHDVSPLSSHC